MTRARDAADQINRVNSSAADANAITIDSSENVLVGTTSAYPGSSSSANVVGVSIENAYGIHSSANGQRSLLLNRMTSDGTIAEFRKDATTVGSIASRAGAVTSLILDPRSNGGGLTAGGPALYPTDNAGSPSNGNLSLGDASAKFKDLYLSGGVFLGGTGAANKLDDYEEGSWTPTCTVGLSLNAAKYVKIGSQVTLTCYAVINSNANGTHASIGGLPFVSTVNGYAAAPLNHNSGSAGTPTIRVEQNSTSAFVVNFNNGAVSFAALSSSIFIFSVTYTTPS